MRIEDIIVSFVFFVLVTGLLGYALVRILEATISISAKTRQLLFAAVMVLPLTTFALAVTHWTKVCSFITNRFFSLANLLFIPHSRLIMTLLLGSALVYVLKAQRGSNFSHDDLALIRHPLQYERVYKLLAELGASHLDLAIYEFPYPFACASGVRTPKVLLASSLLELMDDQELKAVLAHEVAHVRSNDNLLNNALTFVKRLTFFSPVSHLAYIRYGIAREEAADDFAAATIGQPADLASALVKVVRASRELTQWQPQPTGYSALHSSQALQRAERILTEPYTVPYNLLLERGILFTMTTIIPMFLC